MITENWADQRSDLADRLRELRVYAGLSGKRLSELAGWQPSKVSRVENGRQLPSGADVTRWGELCGADPSRQQELIDLRDETSRAHRDWNRRVRQGQLPVQQNYNEFVARASMVRHFETTWIPGLLQTAAYARCVLVASAEAHQVQVDDADLAVSARMRRQQHLYDPTKTFEFLLTEPVLRWRFCPVDVIRAQLDRVRAAIGLPNVRIGIVPLDTVLATAPQNAFQLYDDVAIVETFVGETIHTPAESAEYAAVLDRLWNDAMVGQQAAALIDRAVGRLPAC